ARLAIFPPGDAREDWTILRALSAVLGKTLPYDNLLQVRASLAAANPVLAEIDAVRQANWGSFGTPGPLEGVPFRGVIDNFYMTDPISRASLVMAECTQALLAAD